MTELDIIKHVMVLAGEEAVTDPNSTHPTAQAIKTLMYSVSREMQSRGWWFNTEYSLKLSKNDAGEVIVPDGTLSVDPVDSASGLILRGSRFYDPTNHTYAINQDVYVDAIIELSVSDLPHTAANYVKHKVAHDFLLGEDADKSKTDNMWEKHVAPAWAALQQEHLQASDVNSNTRASVRALRSRTVQYGSGNPLLPGGR